VKKRIRYVLLFLSSSVLAQDAKPNFTGTWEMVTGTRAGHAKTTTRIEQTDSTFAISPILPGSVVVDPVVYPIDGTETKQKIGRRLVKRKGHWEGAHLVLEVAGRFRGRQRTTQQAIWFSYGGKIMNMSFHVIGGDPRRDYEFASERIPK
jgi:hypothetical protein